MSLEHWIKGKAKEGDTRAANLGRALLNGFGEVSLPGIEKASDLDGEWTRQAGILADLFAKELKMTKEQYLDSLPKFTSQQEEFKGRFDIPVIVETRVTPERQFQLAGIETFFDNTQAKDWDGDSEEYKTPVAPYVTWMQDGTRNLGKSVRSVRKELAKDERGATVFDGVALIITHPDILKKHFIDLPSSRVGSDNAPGVCFWDGRPRLSRSWVDGSSRSYGSASCGRV